MSVTWSHARTTRSESFLSSGLRSWKIFRKSKFPFLSHGRPISSHSSTLIPPVYQSVLNFLAKNYLTQAYSHLSFKTMSLSGRLCLAMLCRATLSFSSSMACHSYACHTRLRSRPTAPKISKTDGSRSTTRRCIRASHSSPLTLSATGLMSMN